MKLAPCLLLTLIITAGTCLSNEATAGGAGSYGHLFANPGWTGYHASPYSLGQIPMPPYFALHPPVYYSYPVARTYGYSPYAYGRFSDVRTPEIEMPEVIENPHVEPKPAVRRVEAKTVQSQVILNPYVKQRAIALSD